MDDDPAEARRRRAMSPSYDANGDPHLAQLPDDVHDQAEARRLMRAHEYDYLGGAQPQSLPLDEYFYEHDMQTEAPSSPREMPLPPPPPREMPPPPPMPIARPRRPNAASRSADRARQEEEAARQAEFNLRERARVRRGEAALQADQERKSADRVRLEAIRQETDRIRQETDRLRQEADNVRPEAKAGLERAERPEQNRRAARSSEQETTIERRMRASTRRYNEAIENQLHRLKMSKIELTGIINDTNGMSVELAVILDAASRGKISPEIDTSEWPRRLYEISKLASELEAGAEWLASFAKRLAAKALETKTAVVFARAVEQ